jgi:hypothetical protein
VAHPAPEQRGEVQTPLLEKLGSASARGSPRQFDCGADDDREMTFSLHDGWCHRSANKVLTSRTAYRTNM